MEERLVRKEFEAVRCLLGAISYAASARDDLARRLAEIPGGQKRMEAVVAGLRDITDAVIDTVPQGQCRQLKNTMNDMEMRMVPKLTGMSQNVVLEKDNAKALIDIAMEKCRGCVEDGVKCRECGLYKVLEGFLPLDTYGNGLLCPYSISEWID